MTRFKNHLIAAAVLSVLAVIGTIMNSPQASAQDQGNVSKVAIVSPIPLPVTGSTTVTGNVGILGTPAVTLSGNSAVNPLFVRDISEAAAQPFQFSASHPVGGAVFTVPSNTRLVIEYVSYTCGAAQAGAVGLGTTVNGSKVIHWIQHDTSEATGNGFCVTGRQVRIYADPLTDVIYQNFESIGPVDLSISGHLVSLP
jgi:hypothetical protein